MHGIDGCDLLWLNSDSYETSFLYKTPRKSWGGPSCNNDCLRDFLVFQSFFNLNGWTWPCFICIYLVWDKGIASRCLFELKTLPTQTLGQQKFIWVFPKKKRYPQIIHFNKVIHYKPSILGYPYFWKHPFEKKNNEALETKEMKTLNSRCIAGHLAFCWICWVGLLGPGGFRCLLHGFW